MSYKLKLDVFEGPLDLLLYLIKKNEINIYDIPIAVVTQQYMEYVEMMKLLDLELVGDFLVMAATLIQIKSRMLLPPDPVAQEQEEQDPRDELVRRLLEYKRFKEAAEELRTREVQRQDLFARAMDEEKTKALKDESKEVYFEASLFDLITAFTSVLKNVPEEIFYEIIKEEHTVEQKIHDILHLLLEQPNIMLMDLFMKAKNKLDVIVTFLAILELIRLREILVVQKKVFGDIEVIRNRENITPAENIEEKESVSPSEEPQGSQENPPPIEDSPKTEDSSVPLTDSPENSTHG